MEVAVEVDVGVGRFKLSLGSSVSSRPRRLFDTAQVAWRLTRMGFEKHMSTVYSPRAVRPFGHIFCSLRVLCGWYW